MRNIIYILLAIFCSSCTTNYYYVTLTEDTALYSTRSEGKPVKTVIPANSKVYINTAGTTYKRVKYGKYKGWALNPGYTGSTSISTSQPVSKTYRPASTISPSGSKTVHVKGYTRKDGTYVRPHTRSAPRRR